LSVWTTQDNHPATNGPTVKTKYTLPVGAVINYLLSKIPPETSLQQKPLKDSKSRALR